MAKPSTLIHAHVPLEPAQPRDVKVDVINPRTVKITWNSPLTDVTSYMVKWTQRGQPGVSAVDNQKVVKVMPNYEICSPVGLI